MAIFTTEANVVVSYVLSSMFYSSYINYTASHLGHFFLLIFAPLCLASSYSILKARFMDSVLGLFLCFYTNNNYICSARQVVLYYIDIKKPSSIDWTKN